MMKWEEWYRVARDEKLWQNREEKGLLKAEYVTDYILRLWFEENLKFIFFEATIDVTSCRFKPKCAQ
ncbi:MAG: hypothetical protein B6243_10780 [Anaerolineaceae bacterium 4572_5.2]|nr:MAG: hypothetical protein B6243_10780 [Anaerolineaceae bacterium 4572_5.2]